MAMMNLKAIQKEKVMGDDEKKPMLLKRKPFMKADAPMKKSGLAARLTGGK